MRAEFIAWLVSRMLVWTLPPEAHDASRARYALIAEDALDVGFDVTEPPLYAGEDARARTTVQLLSIGSFESHFREDVEKGVVRGDGGSSWCLMQIRLGSGRIRLAGNSYVYSTHEGWSGKDLAADRKKCFRSALHIARTSMTRCGDLTMYGSGSCGIGAGVMGLRVTRANSVLKQHPWFDAEILLDL